MYDECQVVCIVLPFTPNTNGLSVDESCPKENPASLIATGTTGNGALCECSTVLNYKS